MVESISGLVTDESGKPLANVKVLARHEPTGSLFAQFTGEDGRFHFDNVKVGGPYELSASIDGFEPMEERGLKLRTGEDYRQDFQLVTAKVEI